jgi:CheY-like chemotaxis protein/HPt (histidine-containing phosphotransfer) domain-containing protein
MLTPAQVTAARAVVAAAPKARWRIPASRVLVVDDGAENRELLSLVLAEQGLWVEEAENGQVALDKVAAGGFDLILMDMHMPVMDGSTAVRALRSRGVATPIIAFSADAMKGYEAEALAAGCTACLTKPIDIDALLDRLAQLLGGERLAPDASSAEPILMPASAPAPLAPGAGPDSGTSRAMIHSRFANQPRLSPIVAKFAARLRARIDEAWAYHAKGDFEERGRFGHWLAGSAGMMGYDSLTSPARELEALAKAGDGSGSSMVLARLDGMCNRLAVPESVVAS